LSGLIGRLAGACKRKNETALAEHSRRPSFGIIGRDSARRSAIIIRSAFRQKPSSFRKASRKLSVNARMTLTIALKNPAKSCAHDAMMRSSATHWSGVLVI
jgi:hypothetical protein